MAVCDLDVTGGPLVVDLVSGVIQNCKVEGTLRVSYHGTVKVGGIAGTTSEGGIIKDCRFNGNITSETGNIDAYAGGITALLQGGTVENCTVEIKDECLDGMKFFLVITHCSSSKF